MARCIALLAGLLAAFGAAAGQPAHIHVAADGSVPGIADSALPAYLVKTMGTAGIDGWTLDPADAKSYPDYILWSFRLNPYAGGSTRHVGFLVSKVESLFGVHRYVTVEARLFLNGEYQALSSGQAEIQGGTRDADLRTLVVKLTRDLAGYADLGPEAPPGL